MGSDLFFTILEAQLQHTCICPHARNDIMS